MTKRDRNNHFAGDIESITAGGKVVHSAEKHPRLGRVVRRHATDIPFEDFSECEHLIRGRVRGCGLYALYANDQLIYVGLATHSIRSRIRRHILKGDIKFTHFSVFLVTGKNTEAQARRIRDLEALLLQVIRPLPKMNKVKTKFVAARRLKLT